MTQRFPKPLTYKVTYKPFRGNINLKSDQSNYATKADLKNTNGIDTSKLAIKYDLASLKTELDKKYGQIKDCSYLFN